MKKLADDQKKIITDHMVEQWKDFDTKYQNHALYLLRQQTRRMERQQAYCEARHKRRFKRKLELLGNVPDSQADAFLLDLDGTGDTMSEAGTLYEPREEDFMLEMPEEDPPQIDASQEPSISDVSVRDVSEADLSGESEESVLRTVIHSSESLSNIANGASAHDNRQYIPNSSSERMTQQTNVGGTQDPLAQWDHESDEMGPQQGPFEEVISTEEFSEEQHVPSVNRSGPLSQDSEAPDRDAATYDRFANENKVTSTQDDEQYRSSIRRPRTPRRNIKSPSSRAEKN